MSSHVGEQAVVVGAGIGGLAAAGALADHFERVLVLERGDLPAPSAARAGTPKGAHHAHGLLAGGLDALCRLFPGLEQDLAAAGAVKVRAGLDVRMEQPGFDPFPQRDLGWDTYLMSRPLTEFTLRGRVEQLANVSFRTGAPAEALMASPDGGGVTGVRLRADDGPVEVIAADLIVDASDGLLTLELLKVIGRKMPDETIVGVDLGYSTQVFAKPNDAPKDWTFLLTAGRLPGGCHSGGVFPMEDELWMVGLAGYGAEQPPGDREGYMAFARGLRTPTLFNAIRGAKPVGNIVRHRFPASIRRHFERLPDFPRGLLPFSDAICRFNPAYGQGMSVAAQEARLLQRLLGEWAEGDPIGALAANFFAGVQDLIETPWKVVTALDFRFPHTCGEASPNRDHSNRYATALRRLAAQEPEVHSLWQQVSQLLKPPSVLTNPDLTARVVAMMAQ